MIFITPCSKIHPLASLRIIITIIFPYVKIRFYRESVIESVLNLWYDFAT